MTTIKWDQVTPVAGGVRRTRAVSVALNTPRRATLRLMHTEAANAVGEEITVWLALSGVDASGRLLWEWRNESDRPDASGWIGELHLSDGHTGQLALRVAGEKPFTVTGIAPLARAPLLAFAEGLRGFRVEFPGRWAGSAVGDDPCLIARPLWTNREFTAGMAAVHAPIGHMLMEAARAVCVERMNLPEIANAFHVDRDQLEQLVDRLDHARASSSQ